MQKKYFLFFIIFSFLFCSHLYSNSPVKKSQPKEHYYFYNPDGIGAHAFYNPYSMVLEAGFEALYDRRIDQYPFADGTGNVLRSFSNPDLAIRAYGGYGKFFREQFLPLEAGKGWVPNYLWHFLGGGFRTRLLEEYYSHHDYYYPKKTAWLAMYIGHFLNEVVQAEGAVYGTADALADLLFFDWIGKIFFSYDSYANFFRYKLNLKEWTYQMSLDPVSKRLLNNGQQFLLRYPFTQSVSLGFLSGNMHNSLLFIYSPNKNKSQYSLGFGFKPEDFNWNDGQPNPSFFSYSTLLAYSEFDNPIFTFFYQSGRQDNDYYLYHEGEREINRKNIYSSNKLIINIYPKWLDIYGVKPGFTFAWQYDAYYVGITTGLLPLGVHRGSDMGEKYLDDF